MKLLINIIKSTQCIPHCLVVVNKICAKITEKPFLPIFIFTSVFFIIAAYLLPIRFEENDDVVMLLIASGKITGTPEFFLVFINSIYGFFVSSLYKILPSVEWYTVLFSILHIVSLSIIVLDVIKRNNPLLLKLSIVFLFFIFEFLLIQKFQFTTTAGLTSLAGLVLISNTKKIIGGITLFVIASLIRFEAAFLVLLVFSPIVFWEYMGIHKINVTPTCKSICIAIIIAISCKGVNSYIVNQNPQMQEYVTYNKLRGQIHDNPNAWLLLNDLPNNIDKNDYGLFLSFLIDPHVFNTSTLLDINAKISNVSLIKRMIHVVQFISCYFKYFISLVLISALFYLYSRKKYRIIIATSFLVLFITLCYVSSNGSIKMRVFITAILPIIYTWSLFYPKTIKNSNLISFIVSLWGLIIIAIYYNFWCNVFLLFILGVIILFMFALKDKFSYYIIIFFIPFMLFFAYNIFDRFLYVKNTRQNTTENLLRSVDFISSYTSTHNKCVLQFPGHLPIEKVNPFFASKQIDFSNIVCSGWLTNYPYQKQCFNSFKQLTENTALFIRKNNDAMLSSIQESIERNYNIKTEIKTIAENKNAIIIEFLPLTIKK